MRSEQLRSWTSVGYEILFDRKFLNFFGQVLTKDKLLGYFVKAIQLVVNIFLIVSSQIINYWVKDVEHSPKPRKVSGETKWLNVPLLYRKDGVVDCSFLSSSSDCMTFCRCVGVKTAYPSRGVDKVLGKVDAPSQSFQKGAGILFISYNSNFFFLVFLSNLFQTSIQLHKLHNCLCIKYTNLMLLCFKATCNFCLNFLPVLQP